MGKAILAEQVSPDTPAADKVALYPKAGGKYYQMADDGVEHRLADDSLIRRGVSTFQSTTGRTITLDPVVAGTDYAVSITPSGESDYIGEIWISSRATNAFVVKNSGSDDESGFGWSLMEVAAP
jgi:hypothetical protein